MGSPRVPLALAQATLSLAAPALASIDPIVALVSDFLDVSAIIRPPQAAALRSTRLFYRVIDRVMADDQHGLAWRSHWCCRAMWNALTNDDLVIAQIVHAVHPEPLAVRSLEVALRFSTLETVQWVVENRHDRLCCGAGAGNMCRRCLSNCVKFLGRHDAKRVVEWFVSEGALVLLDSRGKLVGRYKSLPLKHVELLQWCHENDWLTAAMLWEYLLDSLRHEAGDAAVVRYLVDLNFPVSDEQTFLDALACGACNPVLEEVVDVVTASHLCDHLRDKFVHAATRPDGAKVLQWDKDFLREDGFSSIVSAYAMAYGHLETLQWLVGSGIRLNRGRGHTFMNTPEQSWLDVISWASMRGMNGYADRSTMRAAAQKGYLEVVKYLYSAFTPGVVIETVMEEAAAHGHLHVLQWLHQKRSVQCTPQALYRAAENNHLHVVQWIHKVGTQGSMIEAIAVAAQAGQLKVLAWLYDNAADVCPACVLHKVFFWMRVRVYQNPEFRMLHCLQWLASKKAQSHGFPCATCAAPRPAHRDDVFKICILAGDLAVIEYVHENHRDVFTWPRGIHLALHPGDKDAHVGVLSWLRRVRDFAQRNGQSDVLAQLAGWI